MRIRLLANIVSHDGMLFEGTVVETDDHRAQAWVDRGDAMLAPVEPATTPGAVAPEPLPTVPVVRRTVPVEDIDIAPSPTVDPLPAEPVEADDDTTAPARRGAPRRR